MIYSCLHSELIGTKKCMKIWFVVKNKKCGICNGYQGLVSNFLYFTFYSELADCASYSEIVWRWWTRIIIIIIIFCNVIGLKKDIPSTQERSQTFTLFSENSCILKWSQNKSCLLFFVSWFPKTMISAVHTKYSDLIFYRIEVEGWVLGVLDNLIDLLNVVSEFKLICKTRFDMVVHSHFCYVVVIVWPKKFPTICLSMNR